MDELIEQLCNTKTIDELQKQLCDWQTESGMKGKELREVVGNSYRDLLVSADLILEMEQLSKTVIGEVETVKSRYADLGETSSDKRLEKVSVRDAEDVANFVFNSFEDIHTFLDRSEPLQAVQRFLEVQNICTCLYSPEHIIRQKLEEQKLTQFVVECWNSVLGLQQLVEVELQSNLSKVGTSLEELTSLLSGLYLLDTEKRNGEWLCQKLFNSRKSVLEHILESLKNVLNADEENGSEESLLYLERGMKIIGQLLSETDNQAEQLFGSNTLQETLKKNIASWDYSMVPCERLFPQKSANVAVSMDAEDWKYEKGEWIEECRDILNGLLPTILSKCRSCAVGARAWRQMINEVDPKMDTWNAFGFHDICVQSVKEMLLYDFNDFEENQKLSQTILKIPQVEQTTQKIGTIVDDFAKRLTRLLEDIQSLLSLADDPHCPSQFKDFLSKEARFRVQRSCQKTFGGTFFRELLEIDFSDSVMNESIANNSMFLACVLQSLLPELTRLKIFLPTKLDEICEPIKQRSEKGFELWSKWLSQELRKELELNLGEWHYQWQRPEKMKQAWKAIDGPLDDDVMYVPSVVSNHVLVFLFKLTHHMHQAYERLGGSSTLFQQTMRTIRRMLVEVFYKFLKANKKLPEAPAMQMILDTSFLFQAIPVKGDTRVSDAFSKKLMTFVDPIEWTFCEKHVQQHVSTMLARTSLLFGHGIQNNELASKPISSSLFPRAKPLPLIPLLPIPKKQTRQINTPKRETHRSDLFKIDANPKEETLKESLQALKDSTLGALGASLEGFSFQSIFSNT